MRQWSGFDIQCASCGNAMTPLLAGCAACRAVRPPFGAIAGSLLTERARCLLCGDTSDVVIDDRYCVGAEYALRMRTLGVLDDAFRFAGVGMWIQPHFETVRSGGNPRDPVHLRQARLWLAGFDVVLRANLDLRNGSIRADVFGPGRAALAAFLAPMDGAQPFDIFNAPADVAITFEKWSVSGGPDPSGPAAQSRLRLAK